MSQIEHNWKRHRRTQYHPRTIGLGPHVFGLDDRGHWPRHANQKASLDRRFNPEIPMDIHKLITDDPLRYIARDNPRIWVEHEQAESLPIRGGREYAVYWEPYDNWRYPQFQGGIQIEITGYQTHDYLLHISCEAPTADRTQHNFSQRYGSFGYAKKTAIKELAERRRWLLMQVETEIGAARATSNVLRKAIAELEPDFEAEQTVLFNPKGGELCRN
jgi:hypothetical protein